MSRKTKKNVINTIIVFLYVLVGILIIGFIVQSRNKKDLVYSQSAKIDDAESFKEAMNNNLGNAFIHGELEAVDSVSFPEVSGEYMYIIKVTEAHNSHNRTVTYTTYSEKGMQTHTKNEIYHSWDVVNEEEKKSERIKFLGEEFNGYKINMPKPKHIKTVQVSDEIRNIYYGVDTNCIGTIFTELRDGTISDYSDFYINKDIEETLNHLNNNQTIIIFLIVWLLLMCISLIIFNRLYW